MVINADIWGAEETILGGGRSP